MTKNISDILKIQEVIKDNQASASEILEPALRKLAPGSDAKERERIIALAQVLIRGSSVACASVVHNQEDDSPIDFIKNHSLDSIIEINHLFAENKN